MLTSLQDRQRLEDDRAESLPFLASSVAFSQGVQMTTRLPVGVRPPKRYLQVVLLQVVVMILCKGAVHE